MDEPFASVDAQTRTELEDLVLKVCAQFSMTMLFVTHDIDECVYLADRVVVLSAPPAVVMDTVHIPFGTERDQIATRAEPEFIELRKHIAQLIRDAGRNRGLVNNTH
jgi:NitT/TauT family transport system ATP-binding protein